MSTAPRPNPFVQTRRHGPWSSRLSGWPGFRERIFFYEYAEEFPRYWLRQGVTGGIEPMGRISSCTYDGKRLLDPLETLMRDLFVPCLTSGFVDAMRCVFASREGVEKGLKVRLDFQIRSPMGHKEEQP